jgi:peptidoglycan/xylan/chitin deacetylase (PgdA/CDA1 family)
MPTDPDRYVYAPIDRRPKLSWPDGARLAFWVVVNHEVYEFDPPRWGPRRQWPRVHPDVLAYSHRDYGNRVGSWRLLEAMDRCALRGSLSLNVAALTHYPEFTDACVERGWEVMSHGVYNTRYVFDLTEDEERSVIADCAEAIERQTGIAPVGWIGPSLTMTERTLDLLPEYGFRYSLDMFHDDQPFPVKVRNGRLITIPYTVEVNDIIVYGSLHHTPREYGQMIKDQFDVLYAEGADDGRVMCVALHPYLVAQPHRLPYLEDALRYVTGHEDVWLTTGAEIADWYYDRFYDEVAQALGYPLET